jgi:MFS family permease
MVRLIADRGIRVFTLVWTGELVSNIGSGLTNFALSVWVYQQTGSATEFALIITIATAPSVIALPLVGALIDRWNHRWTMMVCNLGAGLSTLTLTVLALAGRLRVWHIFVAVFVRAIFITFLEPTYSAAITLLVPRVHLSRASGMVQSAQASTQVLSPLLAGILLTSIQVHGITLIDCLTYLFALGTLVFARLPAVERTVTPTAPNKSFIHELSEGWRYIYRHAGLLALLGYFAVFNFFIGMSVVLLPPLILSFNSPRTLGVALSIVGAGFLLGSLLIAAWGGPRNRVLGVVGPGLLCSICITLIGVRPYLPLVVAGAFGMQFFIPFMNACVQSIWQSKTPIEIQGRVFSARRLIVLSMVPAGYLIAGPLANKVFQPLIAGGSQLSLTLKAIVGTGSERGLALVYIVAGVFTFVSQLAFYVYPRLNHLEQEIPDVTAVRSLQPATPPDRASAKT